MFSAPAFTTPPSFFSSSPFSSTTFPPPTSFPSFESGPFFPPSSYIAASSPFPTPLATTFPASPFSSFPSGPSFSSFPSFTPTILPTVSSYPAFPPVSLGTASPAPVSDVSLGSSPVRSPAVPIVTSKAAGPVKITYFPVKGRGFFPMLVAEVGGIPYEWKKVSMEEWPDLKPHTPFGQLPVMEHGDVHIAQSNAIAAYIGRLAGLLGTESVDFAVSEMLVAQYEDMLSGFAKHYYSPNKQEEVDKYLAEKLPVELNNLEKLVSGGFTNERTIGELAIFAFLNIMLDMKPDCLDAFPALTAFYKHIAAEPKVASFLAERVGNPWYKRDW